MSENISYLILLAPTLFFITAIASWFQSGVKPKSIILFSKISSLFSLAVVSAMCIYSIQHGLIESGFLGYNGLGLSIRLDPLSLLIIEMIALLAFVINKFSINYLDGDARHGAFMGRLAATIASVQLLVIAGNIGLLFIAWLATSISLHRLLLFYPNRLGARVAARKKFIMARMGDGFLLCAFVLLYNQFGTGNLEAIFSEIRNGASQEVSFAAVEISTIFIAFAAILKSAQFPTHGWLIEVMETPTPVSALLHAGILNAGPFLVVRLSPIMDLGLTSPLLLVLFGGSTALIASVALTTQPSVKIGLGYSSAAHMGFMLLVCGLGVYSAAILHLVAHSFYKAHAFLSSGSAVEIARARMIKTPQRKGSFARVVVGSAIAIVIYGAFAYITDLDVFQNPALLVIGIILILGMSQIIAPTVDTQGNAQLMVQGVGMAALVAIAFFSLESLTHFLLKPVLPSESTPELSTLVLAGIVLATFIAAVFAQIWAPAIKNSAFTKKLYVHFRNGLYANILVDRMIGSYKRNKITHE